METLTEVEGPEAEERRTHLATLASYGYQECLMAFLVDSETRVSTGLSRAVIVLERAGVDCGSGHYRPVAVEALRLRLVQAGRWAIRSGHVATEDRVHGCRVDVEKELRS